MQEKNARAFHFSPTDLPSPIAISDNAPIGTGRLTPGLARLVDAWPGLSATAKRMILAAVDADQPGA